MKRLVLNVAGLCVAIVAVLLGIPSMYLMAAILWLIPAASYLMGWLMLAGLTCERALPEGAKVGEAVPLTYRLGCVSRLPKMYLLVRDTLPPGVQFVDGPPPLVLSLWPGDEQVARSQIEARRRGVFSFGPALIYSTDPLGLQTFTQKMPQVSELIVYPAVLPIRVSWLRGAAAQGWRGTASALTRGAGDDFYGVREYGPGDELRRVHWRTTARTGTLAVTEYTQGITLEVTLALDLSRAAYAGTGDDESGALESAVTLTATLADDLLRYGHTVRMLIAEGNSEKVRLAHGSEDLPRFLDLLARVQADSPLSLADVLRTDGERRGRTATLVVITPDAEDPELVRQWEDWEARGGQCFGFALDSGSFRTGMSGLPDTFGGPAVRVIRRGDDLQRRLEREEDGWGG